jgi:hypothetical protein
LLHDFSRKCINDAITELMGDINDVGRCFGRRSSFICTAVAERSTEEAFEGLERSKFRLKGHNKIESAHLPLGKFAHGVDEALCIAQNLLKIVIVRAWRVGVDLLVVTHANLTEFLLVNCTVVIGV